MNSKELTKKLRDINDFLNIKLYLVGGSVRDLILKRDCNDLDLVTASPPDVIEASIRKAERKPYLVGKRFGTIGMKFEGEIIEITTFRQEKYKPNNRKPEVNFVSNLNDDLERRDFTMNAIAMDQHQIYDPLGGIADIDSKMIRSVGNPRSRFREDPLRILRAVRFQSQLGFMIEAETYKRMGEMSYKLLTISKERWTQEIDKLLMGDFVYEALMNCWKTDIFKWIIPELGLQKDYEQSIKQHKNNLDIHTAKAVAYSPKDLDLRWALLLHDVAKPFTRCTKYHKLDGETRTHYYKHELLGVEIVDKIGKHLKFSTKRMVRVKELVLNHMQDNSPLREFDIKAKD